jgi:bifunctional N-acetylglucosamine-1-phosphate-uridyltransferase/glucosamine-1-phosphate-acetyltransferase GlmU-like protein
VIELLLASGLSCASSQELLNRVNEYARRNSTSETYIQEVIDVIKEDNPECFNEGSVHD